MQRLLIRTFTRPNEKFNSPLPFQTILRHYSSESKSGLGRTRLMKSQPSPTTSTEPPTRIPKPISHVQPDAVLDEATKANLASNPNATFQSNEEEVLYERTPTWWIKWVWILIGMDIVWSGNFAEFIFNRWTRQVDPPKDRPLTPEELKEVEWVPRPLWQRAGLSLLVLAGGTGIAAALLLAQAHETEVIAKLPGSRGEFLIGLDGAKIRGEAGEIGQVKQNFNHTFSQWKGLGREINPTSPALGRWKSGPAA
ncbi:hypothetical protein RHS01_04332 [Rhizoctonia solani]|uniref:Uncharacterized protein n=1 Tax=Rhizoctonia solani TaxID=456999 RepID=A0A8H7IFK0_9AGAM|nr:hypothetical protein RHS01_04332 [Rhizoctonia solani]